MSGAIGNLFGSKGTPAVQQQSSASGLGALPQWAQDLFKSGVTQAQTASQDPSLFTPAAMNGFQTGAGDLISQGYTPINADTFGQNLSIFTNPFEDQVVNKAIGDLRTTGSGLLNDLGSGATAAGGFGGTRQAALESQLIKDTQQQAADTSAGIRSNNYNQAAQNALSTIGTNNALQGQQISDMGNYGGFLQQQQTAEKQAPLEAINYFLNALGIIPATSNTQGNQVGGSTDQGFLSRLGSASGGIASIGSMFSDARLKDNIRSVGARNGYPVYEFTYKGDNVTWRGVMAQDVLHINPDAIGYVQGYMTVDYDKIGFPMERVN